VKHENGLIAPQDVFVVQIAKARFLGTVVILSTIKRRYM
jgi:hypothetical protein